MPASSPLPILIILAIVALMGHYVLRAIPIHSEARYESIDGLRGFLALLVFVHHGRFWYEYLHVGKWEITDSNLYLHLGQGAVSFFFMITAFLFTTKLLNSAGKPVDWARLYVGRITRLVPMYLVAVGALYALVAVRSGFQLQEPIGTVGREAATWLAFKTTPLLDINGVPMTWILVAGVFWSLAYEWLFYLLLPFFGLAARVKVNGWALLLVCPFLLWIHHGGSIERERLYPFVGGILAAYLHRVPKWREIAVSPMMSVVAIACVTAAIFRGPNVYTLGTVALYSAAFCIVAGGNTIFGLFVQPFSKRLGEISYSIYLTHGIVLSIVFGFLLPPLGPNFTPIEHWLVIFAATPVLLLLSMCTYLYIERPGMKLTKGILAALPWRAEAANEKLATTEA